MEVKFEVRPYLDVIHNKSLLKTYEENIKTFGHYGTLTTSEFPAGGSTDMGNVSYVVPSIHPMYYIGSDAFNHTREFNTATGIMFVCVKEKFDISLPIVKFLLAIHVVFGLWKSTTFVSPYITMYMYTVYV